MILNLVLKGPYQKQKIKLNTASNHINFYIGKGIILPYLKAYQILEK
jgi:hypothetical protein